LKTKAEVFGLPPFLFYEKLAGGVPLRGNVEVPLGPALYPSVEYSNREFTESTRRISATKLSGEAGPHLLKFVLFVVKETEQVAVLDWP
jgi:hypothetical protein